MVALSFIDIAIVVTYMATCLAIGFYKSSKIKNIREYAVGNRNFSTLVLVSTLFATYVSASRIGELNGVHTYGLVFAFPLLFMPIHWQIIKHIYAKNIGQFYGCVSMSEIMEKLYGKVGRYASNTAAIATGVGVLTIQVVAIGMLFNFFFGISYQEGIFVGMGVITLYSAFGGIRAVALTDVFQFIIFLIALPITCGYAYYKISLTGNFIHSLPNTHLTLFDNNGSLITLFSFFVFVFVPTIDVPYVQRLLMTKNKKKLLSSFNIISFIYAFLAVVFVLLGLATKVLYPGIEAKHSFYVLVSSLPTVFIGIMIAGILSIIMSSADSWLNTISVIMVNDVLKNLIHRASNRFKLNMAKTFTFVFAFIALLAANINDNEIYILNFYIFAFAFPLYFIPLTAGFLGFKSNTKSFVISCIISFIFTFTSHVIIEELAALELVFSMIGSCIGLFGAHYWQFPDELKGLQRKLVGKLKNIIYSPSRLICKLMQFSIVGQNNNNSGYFLGFTFFFILLNVPIFMFGLASIDSAIMFLRIAGSVLCILLCSAELWLNKSRRELFAYVVLTFCLPFLGIYSYLASGYELIWLVNTIVSVVLFFVLVSRGNAILFGLIGVLLGYGLQSHNTDIMVSNNMMLGQYSSFMLSVLLLGTLYYINLQSKKEKESLKTLGQSIAHDMGVPLSMGIMSTDLLSKALADKDYELAGKYVQEMHTYSKTAMQDVRVMLSSMSTDMSKKPSDWGDYSLSEIVQDAVCNYHLSEQQRSRITVAVETDYKFEGSAVLLRHVLHNLLANAFKYAGEQANISIFVDNVPRTMHGEGYTTLHIKDDGYGIAVDIKEKMFERHVSSGGHGIGLSFCREAMRLMNGDIKCISEKGKGTEFVLSFNN